MYSSRSEVYCQEQSTQGTLAAFTIFVEGDRINNMTNNILSHSGKRHEQYNITERHLAEQGKVVGNSA